MTDIILSFLDTTEPLGRGVTQVTYPSENEDLVIKFALVHKFSSEVFAIGFDGVRDRVVPAHCAVLDRLVNYQLSKANYVHLPKTLHITQIQHSAFPVKHIGSIPSDFLCNRYEEMAVQATVQERIHGKTLYQAIRDDGSSWTLDDWKSVLMQITCSLVQMQQSFGFIQWDSHIQNIMVSKQERSQSLSYVLDDTTTITTPESPLLIKWMDTSSMFMVKCMDQTETMRACAQRLWYNVYMRQHYKKHVYVVPVCIVDWLNIFLGIQKAIGDFSWPQMNAYLEQVCQDAVCSAFAYAYGVPSCSMDNVVARVLRDQVELGCWDLPRTFYQLDETIMAQIAKQMFGSMTLCGSSSQIVKSPASSLEAFKVAHDVRAMRHFLTATCARHGIDRSKLESLVERYSMGELFVPILNRDAFVMGKLDAHAAKTLKTFLRLSG